MNNKPVAWIDPFDLERVPLYDCWVSGEKTKYVDIPLYTLKELTDEEIALVWDEFSALQSPKDIKDFVRAILRKAQEK
jgi:hypothetical protein